MSKNQHNQEDCSTLEKQDWFLTILLFLLGARQIDMLAHYLELLSTADMIMGIEKYAGEDVRQKASSPKLQVLNNALMTAPAAESFEESRSSPGQKRWKTMGSGK